MATLHPAERLDAIRDTFRARGIAGLAPGDVEFLIEQLDALVISYRSVDLALAAIRSDTLTALASAFRKMLPPAELDRLVALIDPDAPLNDFLAVLRKR